MSTRSLQQIWDGLNAKGMGSDKGSVHSYLPVYEELFKPYRETAVRLLEIGVFKGDSLRMWQQYFDTNMIHGIDCHVEPHGGMADIKPLIDEGELYIHILDAEDEKTPSLVRGYFDIIIDDAAHHIEQQLKLYDVWSSRVTPSGGLYIIEDVQDIDRDRHLLEPLGEIVDLRHVKGRYDDVLVICKM